MGLVLVGDTFCTTGSFNSETVNTGNVIIRPSSFLLLRDTVPYISLEAQKTLFLF